MSYNAYDINVLVNGKRCKQYTHQNKTYIESKDGSNYTLEVKNNTGKRILVVSSVDGLSVLTGKEAQSSDTGYVVNPYSKIEIKGFRHSDNAVGAFEFTKKTNNDSYAATKGDQRNVGVIGFRLFSEVERPPIVIKEYVPYPYPVKSWPVWPTPQWNDFWYTTCSSDNSEELKDCGQVYGSTTDLGDTKGVTASYSGQIMNTVKTSGMMKLSATTKGRHGPGGQSATDSHSQKLSLSANSHVLRECKSFNNDMATKWGENIESKVVNVEFERGPLIHSLDIYYASRKTLIDMGIPVSNQQQIASLGPQSFPGEYAEPPKGWRG